LLLQLLFGLDICAQSRQVCGKVFLRDGEIEEAGESVTVYSKACGTGAIAGHDGSFRLYVPDRFMGDSLLLEFSLIGYTTVNRSVNLFVSPLPELEPVVLDLQPLMLAASYSTVSGIPVADFILSQLWDKALENRKRMATYNADIRYSISTHEIPLVAQVLSGFEKGALKFAAGLTDYGPLVRYCLSHDDVSASASLARVVGYGTVKDFNKKIVSSSCSLPKDVSKSILSIPDGIDLFGMVYDRDKPWGEKFAENHVFNLVGTYEYGDKLVDVLYWTDDNKVMSISLHVVEGDWGLLRVEIGREKEVVRFECRDIGNGIFMPVSLVTKPTMSLIRNSELPAVIKYINDNEFVPKGIKKRSEAILTERYESGRDFNPYILIGFNISYANIRYS